MSDPRKISEKVFQGEVRKAALLHGWRFYHTYRSDRSDSGFPDCVMQRGPRLIFAELKSEKGKLTPEQAGWLDGLQFVANDIDIEVYVWRPSQIDEIWEILKA